MFGTVDLFVNLQSPRVDGITTNLRLDTKNDRASMNRSALCPRTSTRLASLLTTILCSVSALVAHAAEEQATPAKVPVVDGIVQPRRPMTDAIADAMKFLKKADGKYVPGKIDGDLAGYFMSCHVNYDGSPSDRQLAYPARQHAYFIFTFLHYRDYTGEQEWVTRARDLADWNLKNSTPAKDFYGNVPYSTYRDGKPCGGADQDGIEPDKAAFLGSAYLALYDVTHDKKYLQGVEAIAETLVKRQGKDGSWPFRVAPADGKVVEQFGGAPVFFVTFFEDLQKHSKNKTYASAHEKALKLMLDRNVKQNQWGTYHEDVKAKQPDYLSAEPISFTAAYLFRHAKEHPEYVEMGRSILKPMEARLVHTDLHPAAPAPAVSEQAGFDHIMPGHTARYCMALAELYKVTGDKEVKKKALSGVNALTYMQSDEGLFRTFFFTVKTKNPDRKKPDWYSQHLYTICHVLEAHASIARRSLLAGPQPNEFSIG